MLLRYLALLVLAVAASTSAHSSSVATSTSIFANSTTSTSNSSSSSSSSSSSKSQCEICRDSGNCSKAYNGAAGQFCNSWLDSSNHRRACCCPASDVCSSDNTYECTCQRGATTRPSYWIWIGLGVFAVGALIGGGIFMAMRKRRMQQRSDRDYRPQAGMAYAQQPVAYGQGGYAQPVYVQPSYGYGDNYQRGGRRGMGTGGAVAMGAAGGLLGGLLIGEALGDMGDGGGDFGGGGGGDFGGGGGFGGDF